MTEGRRRPVRVGVVLDGVRPPAWAAWVVRAIRAHEDLELALAVVCERAGAERPSRLFALYEAADRRLFSPRPDALQPVDVSSDLAGVARRQATLLPAGDGGQRLRDEDVGAVREHSLDVLLQLGAGPLRGDVLSAARHGVWSWHYGDPARHRDEPPLFWELSRGEIASTSVLEILAGDHGTSGAIYRSVTATDPVSLQRTRNPVYWKSARFALRRLDDLAAGRWTPEPARAEAVPDRSPAPSNADTLRHVVKVAGRVVRRRLRRTVSRRQWFLGLRRRQPGVLPHEDAVAWRIVLPPEDRYWADPFVVEADDGTLVFLEEYRFRRGRGELAVGRVEPDGRLAAVEPIMAAGHHLSYPYVFRDGGRRFLVPESSQAHRVELWTATDFPVGWERVAVLLEDVDAVDATILRHDGRYWMWTNVAVPGGSADDETFLYFSDRLEAGWTPHPRNPVVSDARRARPAGRPFVQGGMLIRPAQDCTGRYGARVVFNAVDALTTDDYRERPVASLGPDWASARTLCAHTYTFDGPWEATDGLRWLPRRRRSAP
jgi:hypothetical protein